ncbi:MAG TPA: threonine synthase [Gemmatimonadales bacterium]|nr:threonine synthase [Gemmatimonadales bacterium]
MTAPAAPDWILECSGCGSHRGPAGLPSVCDACGQPWLVRYPARRHGAVERAAAERGSDMWRFRSLLPLAPGEEPVSLGEGDTPLLAMPRTGVRFGLRSLLVKDESVNPTGSFKARGLSAAVTRATAAGATGFVLPTAGNAGVAAAAYGARAGRSVRVYAPRSTPRTILSQIVSFGGELALVDGHIGDCGRHAREYAAATGAVDLSTLREPYRIEGKKTLGLELALELGWTLPDAIVYPTGGGTGLIGMWKAFAELLEAGWVAGPMPKLFSVQAAGCAPVVRAFAAGAGHCQPWDDPRTEASGLRVPAPLGGRLVLRALRETGGAAVAVEDGALLEAGRLASREEGIDFSPEGGAAVAALGLLVGARLLRPEDRVVVFNTGAGWLYRDSGGLPLG